MIRAALAAIVLLAVAAGWLFSSTGEIDPCRALAAERARHAAHGLPVHWALLRIQRLQTSQMSTGACLGGLIGDWWHRAAEKRRR
jgi:hypothetical protein